MFKHIYLGRLRLLTRSRSDMFWTLVYPIILAIFFTMAFGNIASTDSFNPVPVAIVENDELQSQTAFLQTLKSVSDDNEANTEKLFHVTYTTKDEAEQSLKDNTVKGYIIFDNGPHIVVKDSGFDQSFIKQFMDSVQQIGSSVTTIIKTDPSTASSISYNGQKSYLTDDITAKTATNSMTVSYYGLIAMAAMFGCFWGRKEVEDIQADMSPQGMRLNLAPVHKLKAFASSICASITVQFLALVIVAAFMVLALHVDFGSHFGYIIVTCFFSSIMGVSFGALVASLIRTNQNLRIAVMLTVSLVLSAIAGMIRPDLKYAVTQALPFMAYVNPANLITDGFYALYYYGPGARYFLNMGLMLGFSVIFSIIVYLVTRRQRYASV